MKIFRMVFACLIVLAGVGPGFGQDSLMDRVRALEANNAAIQSQLNGISAMQARAQSDIADVKADVQAVREKLDALAKVVAPAATFKAAVHDPWGPGVSASFQQTTTATTSQPVFVGGMMYGSGMMSSGSCSSGSWGGGSGAGRLFGRRR